MVIGKLTATYVDVWGQFFYGKVKFVPQSNFKYLHVCTEPSVHESDPTCSVFFNVFIYNDHFSQVKMNLSVVVIRL